MIRVLLADDQALVRGGFRAILEAQPDIEVVAEAGDGAEAVAEAIKFRPDVLLLDIRMPQMDGIEATRRVLAATGGGCRVLIVTTFDIDDYVYAALKEGASGFLLKTVPPHQLVSAIRDIVSGDVLLAPEITRRLIEQFVRQPRPGDDGAEVLNALTPRELDVLRLVARGMSNAEIAADLIVSEATAKTHVGRILAKLGARDRVQAVVLAYESGFVRPGVA